MQNNSCLMLAYFDYHLNVQWVDIPEITNKFDCECRSNLVRFQD